MERERERHLKKERHVVRPGEAESDGSYTSYYRVEPDKIKECRERRGAGTEGKTKDREEMGGKERRKERARKRERQTDDTARERVMVKAMGGEST